MSNKLAGSHTFFWYMTTKILWRVFVWHRSYVVGRSGECGEEKEKRQEIWSGIKSRRSPQWRYAKWRKNFRGKIPEKVFISGNQSTELYFFICLQMVMLFILLQPASLWSPPALVVELIESVPFFCPSASVCVCPSVSLHCHGWTIWHMDLKYLVWAWSWTISGMSPKVKAIGQRSPSWEMWFYGNFTHLFWFKWPDTKPWPILWRHDVV